MIVKPPPFKYCQGLPLCDLNEPWLQQQSTVIQAWGHTSYPMTPSLEDFVL
jgi:hypothetical protein